MDLRKFFFAFSCAVVLLLLTASFTPVSAQTAPTLGTAQSFAILGASTVTNTGPTIINGDLGVSPGTSITGFPPGVVNGTTHAADAVAAQAQNDATTAFNSLAGQPCNTNLSGQDLGGLTLTPGVYCYNSSAQLTGTLTLNAQGNPNSVFILKIGSTLTTASNSSIVIVNGGTACNVFFQLGSSATLGTGTKFIGNIFALASVTLNTNASVAGRTVALNGAVTLDSSVVSVPVCGGVSPTGFVQVCKVAGSGVAVGTNFTFTVAGTPETVPAGVAPGGSCGTPVPVPAGTAAITEAIPAGTILAGVSTLPSAGLLVSSNLAAGTATVTVLAGGQTIVTFIDAAIPVVPTNGFLQVCKVAGAGIPVGTNFTFNVAGTMQTIPAGTAPGGSCGTPVIVAAGPAVVTETVPGSTVLVGVSTLPSAGLLVSSNLATGTATVTVLAGGQTIVTFIDAAIPVVPTNGFLQVCKVAGAGIIVGTNFTFNVAGTMQTVPAGVAPAGSCGATVIVPAGIASIAETIPAGTVLAGVSTLPSAGLLVSSNLAAGLATVTVVPGGQTIVTFVDVVPTTGFVRVCKVAGDGITVGTNFSFNLAGTTVFVPAGATPGSSCSPPFVAAAGPAIVREIPIPNAQAELQVRYAANLNIGDSSVNITNTGVLNGFDPGGTICLNVYVFDPDQQMVSCCACPLTPNHLKSLSVRNDLISNPLTPGISTSVVIKLLGSTPINGACNASTPALTNLVRGVRAWGTTLHALTNTTPVTYGITETPFSPTDLSTSQLTSVSTSPSAALLISSDLAFRKATVTVVPGGVTTVTFTNSFSTSELAHMTTYCQLIQANASGFGICRSCRDGALGAVGK